MTRKKSKKASKSKKARKKKASIVKRKKKVSKRSRVPKGRYAAKRKAVKHKATKRKATKRKATKRKATKRKATKRKATKRKATKRKATKRKATKPKEWKPETEKIESMLTGRRDRITEARIAKFGAEAVGLVAYRALDLRIVPSGASLTPKDVRDAVLYQRDEGRRWVRRRTKAIHRVEKKIELHEEKAEDARTPSGERRELEYAERWQRRREALDTEPQPSKSEETEVYMLLNDMKNYLLAQNPYREVTSRVHVNSDNTVDAVITVEADTRNGRRESTDLSDALFEHMDKYPMLKNWWASCKVKFRYEGFEELTDETYEILEPGFFTLATESKRQLHESDRDLGFIFQAARQMIDGDNGLGTSGVLNKVDTERSVDSISLVLQKSQIRPLYT